MSNRAEQPAAEFVFVFYIKKGGFGCGGLEGEDGLVQDAVAEVVDLPDVVGAAVGEEGGKVGAGAAVDGGDFVLRAEGGVFGAAAVEDVGEDGVVGFLRETGAEVGGGFGRGDGCADKAAAVAAGQGGVLQADADGVQAVGEGEVVGGV